MAAQHKNMPWLSASGVLHRRSGNMARKSRRPFQFYVVWISILPSLLYLYQMSGKQSRLLPSPVEVSEGDNPLVVGFANLAFRPADTLTDSGSPIAGQKTWIEADQGNDVMTPSHGDPFDSLHTLNNDQFRASSYHVRSLINEYRKVVADDVVYLTASWFRYLGSYRVEDVALNVTEGWSGFSPPQKRKRRPYTESSTAAFKWDKEEDISKHFNHLMYTCTKIQSGTHVSSEDCLQVLYSLVKDPRCTTRLDSRTRCTGRQDDQLSVKASDIFSSHNDDENTVNVVILGGGPIGLFLANSLTQISTTYFKSKRKKQTIEKSKNSSSPPTFRIFVFENRIVEEGHKMPYTRLWGTETSGGSEGSMDPRLQYIFRALHEDNTVTLPINFWETLLMLSCRDLGVKFIYGEVQDYEDHLMDLTNLIMFDATGHRLQPLIRGQQFGSSERKVSTMFRWSTRSEEIRETTLKRWRFPEKWLDPIGFGDDGTFYSQLELAEQDTGSGRILYPTLSNKKPYSLYRFDINNIPMDKPGRKTLEAVYSDAKWQFQKKHNVWGQFDAGYPVEDYTEGDDSLKENVVKYLEMVQTRHFLGFEDATISIKATEEQGEFFEQLLRGHSLPGESSIPWDRIAKEEYEGNSVLQTNGVNKLLDLATRLQPKSNPAGISVSAYRSRPYLYEDPVVPGGYSLGHGKRQVPLLRVGNSLFSGDTDVSSGLREQMKHVRQLQQKLLSLYSYLDS